MNDADLLNRYASNQSEEAFSELVRRHLNLVYLAAVRRLAGDTHRAEDVTQTVFAELARNARALARHSALEGWLYATTRNVALQAIRTERRRQTREVAATIIAMNDESDPKLDGERLAPVIDAALDRLNQRDREIVLLRFFRGQAFAEIAQRCGISEDAARFRVNRALERMRGLLAQRGVTSTAAAIALAFAEHAGATPADALVKTVTTGALAKAAAVPAGVVVNFLSVMSSTKIATSAAVALACASGFWIHRNYAEWSSARAELGSRTAAYDAAVKTFEAGARSNSPSSASPIAATVTPKSATAVTRAASRDVPRTPSAVGRPVSAGASPAPRNVNWELSRNPEVRAALAGWIKSALRSNNAAFYRLANLTPEQIAAFEDLSLEYDINMGAVVLTLRPESKTVAQVNDDIHRLLGDANFELMQDYAKTKFVRAVTTGLAGYAYNSDAPLSAAQADQLTRIFAESSPKYAAGVPPFPADIDWSIALPRAKAILTSSQHEALTGVAAIARNTIGGLNPAMPGTFGDGLNPPPAVWRLGSTP